MPLFFSSHLTTPLLSHCLSSCSSPPPLPFATLSFLYCDCSRPPSSFYFCLLSSFHLSYPLSPLFSLYLALSPLLFHFSSLMSSLSHFTLFLNSFSALPPVAPLLLVYSLSFPFLSPLPSTYFTPALLPSLSPRLVHLYPYPLPSPLPCCTLLFPPLTYVISPYSF